jgi:endonuclease I
MKSKTLNPKSTNKTKHKTRNPTTKQKIQHKTKTEQNMRMIKLLSLLTVGVVVSGQVTDSIVNPNCNELDYYGSLPADLADWTRDELQALLQSTHKAVNNTNAARPGVGDAWQALIELDPGNIAETVSLIYKNEAIEAVPFSGRYWRKEYVWPVVRGIGFEGPDSADIHNLRPVDVITDGARGEKYFGNCNVLEKEDACVTPAEGGAEDTCVCNRVFQPPERMRGEIARALMYMDLRYDGSEPNTLDLRLVDCPFQPLRDMAYLSQMLMWHFDYPPSTSEVTRNDNACTKWQGNRNPFVDFPLLATVIFGQPQPLPEAGRLTYESCDEIPTESPTFAPNDCEMLNPGDIFFFVLNSENPDDVGFITLRDLPKGLELFLTDNAWNGLRFQEDEGVVSVSSIYTSNYFLLRLALLERNVTNCLLNCCYCCYFFFS